MIRHRKVRAVATFEFLSEVRRVSYLVLTFGMPVFLLAYAALVGGVVALSKMGESAPKVYGIVDGAGLLGLESDAEPPPDDLPREAREILDQLTQGGAQRIPVVVRSGVLFRPFPDEAAATSAVKDGSVRGFFHLRADWIESGAVDAYYAESGGLGTKIATRALRTLIQDRLMRGRVPEGLAARIRDPLSAGREWTIKDDGSLVPRGFLSVVGRFGVPLVFSILLFVAVLGTATSLINGTAVEKENRVVDVLLSSAHADEILTGKLLGQGAAGLLQVTVWFSMAGVTGLFAAARLHEAGVEIPWVALGTGLVFFVAGYLFLGSLMIGTGSLGNNPKEGQQWSLVWILMASLPIALLGVLIENPRGVIARVFTWIPFSSPSIVVFRLSMDPESTAWWEVVGPLAVLLVCIWLALRLGARLFRIGLLLTGGRVSLLDVLRQARLRG